MADLGVAVGSQRHHGDGSEDIERQISDDELDCVRQLHQHPLARSNPDSRETGAEIARRREQLRVGETAFAVHDGDLFGSALRAAREHLGDGQAPPESLRAVAGRDVRRPSDESFHGFSRPRQVETSGCSAS
jgi:hypothetical protein